MLIKWNGDGPLGLPMVDKEGKGPQGTEIILPGWNEITDEQWGYAQHHVKDYLNDNRMELYGKKEVDKESGEAKYIGQPLQDVRADVARNIVKECYNIKCLRKWDEDMKLTSEVRHQVQKQIELCLKDPVSQE